MANEMWGVDPRTGTLKHYGRKGMAWGYNYFDPNYKPIGQKAQGPQVTGGGGGTNRSMAGGSRNYAVRDIGASSRSGAARAHANANTAPIAKGVGRVASKYAVNLAYANTPKKYGATPTKTPAQLKNPHNLDNAAREYSSTQTERTLGPNSPASRENVQKEGATNRSWFENLANSAGILWRSAVTTVGGLITKGKNAITDWATSAGSFIGKRVSDVGSAIDSGKQAFDRWWNGYDTKVATAKRTGADTMDVRPGYKNVHTNGVRDNIGNAVNAAGQWIGDRAGEIGGWVNDRARDADEFLFGQRYETDDGVPGRTSGALTPVVNAGKQAVNAADEFLFGQRYETDDGVPGRTPGVVAAVTDAWGNAVNTGSQVARSIGNRADQAAQTVDKGLNGYTMVNQRANGDVMDYSSGRAPVRVNGFVDNAGNAANQFTSNAGEYLYNNVGVPARQAYANNVAPIVESIGDGMFRARTAAGDWITGTKNSIEDYLRSFGR